MENQSFDSSRVSPLQVQICKRSVEVMDAVRRGAQLAIDECQFQFRNRRWNCSTLETMPVFGKVVTQGKTMLCEPSRRRLPASRLKDEARTNQPVSSPTCHVWVTRLQ